MAAQHAEPKRVFLNIPYEAKFERRYLAFESENHRAQKSISDLNGTDLNIHDGTIEGVMRELCNAFVRTAERPSVPEMVANYRELRHLIPEVLRLAGTGSVFEARVFEDLSVLAAAIRRKRTQTQVGGR
jgi:hypothetical protein